MRRALVLGSLALAVACAPRGRREPVSPASSLPVPARAPPRASAVPPRTIAPPHDESPPPASPPPVVEAPTPIHGVLPLAADARALFHGSPEDPVPAVRGGIVRELEDVSYIVGNEWALEAFHAAVSGLGGGYVGVGPDQAYLLIGWQRPELAWLVDYDPKVLRVHAMYRALVLASQTRREFLAMFEPEGAPRAIAVIDEHDAPDHILRRLYRNNRDMFRWRLVTIARKLKRQRIPSWLTDDETYLYVRQMLVEERVRPLRVNLLEHEGVHGIAEAARELGVPIRVLYLSNAETYWDEYAAQFRANIADLPIDEHSLVLRTVLSWAVNKDYVYFAQPIARYLQWLADPQVKSVLDIVGKKPKADRNKTNYVFVDGMPAH